MIKVDEKNGAASFNVRVCPGASRTKIVGEHDGALKVAVSAAPEKGKANKALLTALAKALGAKKADITLVSGETSRTKRISLRGVGAEALREMLEKICLEKRKQA